MTWLATARNSQMNVGSRYDQFSNAESSEVMHAESDFARAATFFWHRRVPLTVLVILGAVSGTALSYCFTPLYKTDALLIPSEAIAGLDAGGSLGGMGGVGGLASLVGLGASSSRESEAVETLKSRALTSSYIQSNGLLPILFADRWDSSQNTWKRPLFGRPTPSIEDGYVLFDKKIRSVGRKPQDWFDGHLRNLERSEARQTMG